MKRGTHLAHPTGQALSQRHTLLAHFMLSKCHTLYATPYTPHCDTSHHITSSQPCCSPLWHFGKRRCLSSRLPQNHISTTGCYRTTTLRSHHPLRWAEKGKQGEGVQKYVQEGVQECGSTNRSTNGSTDGSTDRSAHQSRPRCQHSTSNCCPRYSNGSNPLPSIRPR